MDITQLKEQVSAKLLEEGYELVSLVLKIEKGNSVLSIVVDRVLPIDMDSITSISRILNAYLDEIDPFENPYTLYVSSLGAEKPLKVEKLHDYINSYVHVHLINPIKGENIYEGDLKEVSDDTIVISYKNKTRDMCVNIDKANISNIRLAIKF